MALSTHPKCTTAYQPRSPAMAALLLQSLAAAHFAVPCGRKGKHTKEVIWQQKADSALTKTRSSDSAYAQLEINHSFVHRTKDLSKKQSANRDQKSPKGGYRCGNGPTSSMTHKGAFPQKLELNSSARWVYLSQKITNVQFRISYEYQRPARVFRLETKENSGVKMAVLKPVKQASPHRSACLLAFRSFFFSLFFSASVSFLPPLTSSESLFSSPPLTLCTSAIPLALDVSATLSVTILVWTDLQSTAQLILWEVHEQNLEDSLGKRDPER